MNPRWALDFLAWWSVALVCLATAVVFPWVILPCVLVLGIAQHAIGNLGHDGLHLKAHRARWVNDLLTGLCTWPLGISVFHWRRWHARHHAYLGHALRDPEVALKIRNARRWRRRGQWSLDIAGLSASEPWQFWRDVHPLRYVFLPMAVWIPLGIVNWRLPALWFAALVTSQQMVFRLRCKLEHDLASLDMTIERERPNRAIRFTVLPCDSWDHADHHRNPSGRRTK